MSKPRFIAFYLPQFHPIPENDMWWGKGFTEWTNVGRGKPYFKGHIQPKIPRDLGYYDLRVPETREEQAILARKAGIEGFCYWHYWFGEKKRLMERPFNEVLESGKPDFPFCLGWANHTWHAKNWNTTDVRGKSDKILIEQKYGGIKDYIEHFNCILPAFKDSRYITIDEKPIFLIWEPQNIPNINLFIDTWTKLAKSNNLKGIYFIGFAFGAERINLIKDMPLNAICADFMYDAFKNRGVLNKIKQRILKYFKGGFPRLCTYDSYHKYVVESLQKTTEKIIPCIVSNFDHSPRSKDNACILIHSNPLKFCNLLKDTISIQKKKEDETRDIIFIKSWNEWGEGNYLEPDYEFKDGYITEMHKNWGNKH